MLVVFVTAWKKQNYTTWQQTDSSSWPLVLEYAGFSAGDLKLDVFFLTDSVKFPSLSQSAAAFACVLEK